MRLRPGDDPPAPQGCTPSMATFHVGERVLIPATGEIGIVTVMHAGSVPRKYTVRIDPPSWSGGAIYTRPRRCAAMWDAASKRGEGHHVALP